MTIICGPQTAVVGYTSTLVCNKLIRIDNIQPIYPDRADLILEGQYASAYTSGSALRRGNEIWTLFLLSKNVPGGTVNIKLTISSDPCAGVSCPDKCIGNDLWAYRCDPKYENLVPVGYECVQDSVKQANSPACVAATHYISLSMGFVPHELVACFETYISAISNNLMTKIAPPPSPWVYVKTTYDRITNSFNLWFYIPGTVALTMTVRDDRGFMQHANPGGELKELYGFMSMSPGALQDLYDWFAAWVPLVTGILLILIAAFGPFGILMDIVLLFAGLVILAWKVFDATSKQLLAETKATNLTIQLDQNNKEDQARSGVEDIWNKSAKTQSDCTTRLQSHRDIHLAKLNGYLDQYAKYPGLVTELNKEKDAFTTNANGIITEFKTVSYTASTCDTYFVRLNSEIGTSNVAINDSLGRYIKIDETYSVACKGWTNQAACEKGGCFWYNSSCSQEEQCWISNPLGGCVLSARTGKAVVGATAAIFLTAFAYWLFTRKKEEVISIYAGAKEAAAAEAERAKAAYRAIRPPPAPAVPQITGAPQAVVT